MAPYKIFVCFAKSSTLFMGSSSAAAVIEADSWAMYVWQTIMAKNHHILHTQRDPKALEIQGVISAENDVGSKSSDSAYEKVRS